MAARDNDERGWGRTQLGQYESPSSGQRNLHRLPNNIVYRRETFLCKWDALWMAALLVVSTEPKVPSNMQSHNDQQINVSHFAGRCFFDLHCSSEQQSAICAFYQQIWPPITLPLTAGELCLTLKIIHTLHLLQVCSSGNEWPHLLSGPKSSTK